MRPADAVRELGNSLLKDLSTRNPPKSSNVDWESINTTIKSCGVIGTTARNSDTLLHAFSESGNELAVQWLLKMGARVSTLGKSGYTALYLAVEKGHEPVIRSLLNGGATVDAQDSKQDPLFRAATLGRVATVRLLLEHRKGSNWAAPELLYQTALNGHAKVIQVLLENGAKDDRSHLQDDSVYFKTAARALRARTALHEAVARGFSVAIIELLVHRDNIRTADKNDNTALHEAALGQSVATVEVLINNGADIHAVNFEGKTALHRAVCKSPSSVAIVKLLLEKGAVVDAIDDDGNTPLQLAVFKDELCPDIVEVLLTFGANVKATEKLVKSALTESVLRGAAPLVDLLLDNGADIAGLLQLRFNEMDYASLVGSLTADKILKRLSSQRRTNSLNTDTRSTLLPRGTRKLSRKWTTCTFLLVRI
jgi:ankyrin repeat protein